MRLMYLSKIRMSVDRVNGDEWLIRLKPNIAELKVQDEQGHSPF